MQHDAALDLLRPHLPALRSQYPIGDIALFGSVTRADFDAERSDIDILVDVTGEMGYDFIELAEELERILGKKVDLVTKQALKPRHWEYLKQRLVYV